ncbi:Rv1355c family protein [Williamsia sterculiae]|uniref:Molybdopterin or thiamine biosynthesis adenylyltransferase n=1 Tax=Williamsia sterculiae TaxID=1344003 RepID=A0A1N7CJG3_9NOCA|nr:Rv1355c family protein [Williamsia sterculiae]SIR63554.1 Molybdopterin or thiamine biosynthesis adenylyltransferase [Williamsia sterculiae]
MTSRDSRFRREFEITIFDPTVDDEVTALDELRSDPSITVVDLYPGQHEALTGLLPAPGDHLLDESARWVYYPWRSSVVRIVGPQGFRRLRLARNLNKLTLSELERFWRLRVGVVGLSVGNAVAYTIALEGLVGTLHLADFDEMELVNLNRVPATMFDLGVNKAVVAARRIAELDPYIRIHVFTDGVTEQSVEGFLEGLDLVVEECDSFDAKILVRDHARRLRLPVIMETSDGGVLDVERFDLEPDRLPFHGLLGDLDAESLRGLTAAEKVPLAMAVTEAGLLTTRMAASLIDVGTRLNTWPQLGSDVALAGASVATAVRRFGLGRDLPSGRTRINLEDHLDTLLTPIAVADVTVAAAESAADMVATLDNEDLVAWAASRAPSQGNGQPWRIDVDDDVVTVTQSATPTASDPHGLGSAVAVGAAAFGMRVAAAARGLATVSAPVDAGDAVGVRLQLSGGDTGPTDEAKLMPALVTSTSHPGLGDGSGLGSDDATALVDADASRAMTLVTDRQTIARVAELLSVAARLRLLIPALHQEMFAEVRWPGDADPLAGIPVGALGMPPHQLPVLQVLRRPEVMAFVEEWDGGDTLGALVAAQVASSSAIAVFSGPTQTREDHLRLGSSAESVWLTAESLGLAVASADPPLLHLRPGDDPGLTPGHRVAELLTTIDELSATVGVPAGHRIAAVLRLFRTDVVAPVLPRDPARITRAR